MSVYCKSTKPARASSRMFKTDYFENYNANMRIYVPAESVEAYKAASGWKTYASQIEGYEFE